MEVKTAPSLLETILSPTVFTPPSPLRYPDHVSLTASPPSITLQLQAPFVAARRERRDKVRRSPVSVHPLCWR